MHCSDRTRTADWSGRHMGLTDLCLLIGRDISLWQKFMSADWSNGSDRIWPADRSWRLLFWQISACWLVEMHCYDRARPVDWSWHIALTEIFQLFGRNALSWQNLACWLVVTFRFDKILPANWSWRHIVLQDFCLLICWNALLWHNSACWLVVTKYCFSRFLPADLSKCIVMTELGLLIGCAISLWQNSACWLIETCLSRNLSQGFFIAKERDVRVRFMYS